MPEAFLVRMHHFVGQPARNRENRKRKRRPHMFFVRQHVVWIVGESTLESVHKGRPLSLFFSTFSIFHLSFSGLGKPVRMAPISPCKVNRRASNGGGIDLHHGSQASCLFLSCTTYDPSSRGFNGTYTVP